MTRQQANNLLRLDAKENCLLDYIRSQIDAQKNEINLFYSNLKLTLPSFIKTLTLGELREANVIIDSNISVPREVELKFRARANVSTKRQHVQDKLIKIQNHHRGQIITYFKELKLQLSKEMLQKRLGELSDEDWISLGVVGTNRQATR